MNAAPPKTRAPWAVWVAAVVAVAMLPFVFSSGASLTMMSLMGFAIIFALSYNMLLGQTGMLSFGHAVYYGLGGFMTAHALNVVGAGKLPVPLPVMPLVGGLAGLFFALIFGWVSTKRAGTAFAMISLGIGELVAACSLILRGFFGGEGGISTSRTSTLRAVRHQLRAADPGLLPDRRLVPAVHRRDVRLHAHAAGPHVQCRAREPRARRVRRLQHADGPLPGVLHLGLLRRRGGRAGRDPLRDRHLQRGRALCRRVSCC